MDEKIKFISCYLNQDFETFILLCERFNISTKTGYKYLGRYREAGVDGLKERSRSPHHHGMRMSAELEETILTVKYLYPYWGAKKVLNWLKQEYPHQPWPAKSTIDDLFKRHQLVRPAKRKRRTAPYQEPFISCHQPNDAWSIDYKGQFKLGNGQFCYPLTITDNYSRYILAIEASDKISGVQTQEVLNRVFLDYGLPKTIRSDNGAPFAGTGLGGLSQLSVWLIKNGIIPERIRTGHPEENGRHERMHSTLKQETTKPAKQTLSEQQKCFDAFIKMFNEIRPHEGIAFYRPSWLYAVSERKYHPKRFVVEYDTSVTHTRKIRSNGTMKWHGKEIFISETLGKERIGLKPFSHNEWIVYFSFMPIGLFNEETLKVSKI